MNRSDLTPSSDKKHNIVLFIDYQRDYMKLIIMGYIIIGNVAEGEKIKQAIDNQSLHYRYQYDEQTTLGYVSHKWQFKGQVNAKKVYDKINIYWE